VLLVSVTKATIVQESCPSLDVVTTERPRHGVQSLQRLALLGSPAARKDRIVS